MVQCLVKHRDFISPLLHTSFWHTDGGGAQDVSCKVSLSRHSMLYIICVQKGTET